jgi:hypothetical protein
MVGDRPRALQMASKRIELLRNGLMAKRWQWVASTAKDALEKWSSAKGVAN